MKGLFSWGLIGMLSLMLMSWGCLGHQAIGLIAERHLTDKAKEAVTYYLGNQSLADVSTWADEIRIQPQYRSTGCWHSLSLPLGLSFPEFQQTVTALPKGNIYKAMVRCEQDLSDPKTSRQEKTDALKFLVHFVGDLHQPMHVSRSEDRNGNKIYVIFNGKGTDLHALWDNRLLEHGSFNKQQLVKQLDHATPSQINEWQSDPLITWLWESYQISTQLYGEIDQVNDHNLSENYYHKYLPIVEDRIEKAGIRLAGILNQVFKSTSFPQATESTVSVFPTQDSPKLETRLPASKGYRE